MSLIWSFNSKFVVIRRPKLNSVVIQTLNSKFYVIWILCIRTYSVNRTCFRLFWHIHRLPCLRCHTSYRVPTRTGKPGKPGKMGRHFPVREKSGNFEQTGKVRENHTKYWKTEINWDKYYLIFLVIFKWTVHCLLKWIKFSVKKNKTFKKYWKNGKKYWKSQGKVREFCQSRKVGTLS